MGSTPEAKVKKLVSAELKKLGPDCWRFMPVQTGFGTPALDYLACINGWFVAIETKKDSKSKLTDRQEATKRDMEAAGGIVLVIYDDASLARSMRVINELRIGNISDGRLYRELANWANRATEAQGQSEQHLRRQQQDQTPDRAAGGDHGAPRKKSARQPKPAARRDDPKLTAAVTHVCDHECVMAGCPTCAARWLR